MPAVWITHSWADNKGDVDFIAQELTGVGLQVKLDRWTLNAGSRLWEQIEKFITSDQHSDAWILIATQNSLASEPCREEFAYALDRALGARLTQFPVIGLFPGPVDDSLIPAGIKTRLYVSLTDPDWKERIKSAVEGRAPNISRPVILPYEMTIFRDPQTGLPVVEVRPRAGSWAPVFAGVPLAEKDKVKPWILVESAGVFSGMAIVKGPFEVASQDGNWWLVTIQDQATPTQSLYIGVDQLPSCLAFGVADGAPQFQVSLFGLGVE